MPAPASTPQTGGCRQLRSEVVAFTAGHRPSEYSRGSMGRPCGPHHCTPMFTPRRSRCRPCGSTKYLLRRKSLFDNDCERATHFHKTIRWSRYLRPCGGCGGPTVRRGGTATTPATAIDTASKAMSCIPPPGTPSTSVAGARRTDRARTTRARRREKPTRHRSGCLEPGHIHDSSKWNLSFPDTY